MAPSGFQHTAARRRLGCNLFDRQQLLLVSTHSRPKAAGFFPHVIGLLGMVSTHSRPKAAGLLTEQPPPFKSFQHTAARRRLETKNRQNRLCCCFNTQPPEGGWKATRRFSDDGAGFNTQPPEGGWACVAADGKAAVWFQHTAARRRLVVFFI